MEDLYKYIINNVTSNNLDKQLGAKMLKMLKDEGVRTNDDIAVIGIGFKLPSASSKEEFWENVKCGINCMSRFPEKRRRDIDQYLMTSGMEDADSIEYVDGSFLDSIDEFDYKLFRITPKEASVMDPYQRVFLQTTWEAIEDAGYGGKKLAGSKTGVFVGYASNVHDSYHKMVYTLDPQNMSIAAIGNITAIIPSRIAYLLDLRGPTMIIDTACSSSLVAIHQACCSIRNGDCDMAVAGGIKIHLIPIDKEYAKVGFESTDGYTRTFDDNSTGTGKGEGIMSVILKPLSAARRDRDNIYAVIKGSAINQDGSSMGITAPNPDSQVDVILRAWEDAGINPCMLSYIEAHGTGTKLGDPIEINSITKAFRKFTQNSQVCPIGTVKPTMGHMYECSGMAGLLNVIMALKHREIPPATLFNKPNTAINFSDSPVYVNTKLRKWIPGDYPMLCGINSFGVSGTNVHMVLEEAPQADEVRATTGIQILSLSAKSKEALNVLVRNYWTFLENNTDIDIGDICYTANTGRGHYNHRLVLIVPNIDKLKEIIDGLCQDGLNGLFDKFNGRCIYREHKIIPGNKEMRQTGEITEAEKFQLSMKAKEQLENFLSTNSEDIKILSELCSSYVQGADVDWGKLYNQQARRKVSLPVYPFEINRCWVGDNEKTNRSSIEKEDSFYYTVEWKPEKLKICDEEISGTVLVLRDGISSKGTEQEIIKWLKEEGREVIEVEIGEEFQNTGINKYTVENSKEDYIKLFKAVSEKNPVQLIHLLTLANEDRINEIEALRISQKRACYSIYYLAYAFMKCNIEDNLDVVMISRYANEVSGEEERIKPENVSLFGFGKSINKELPFFKCRCMDLDDSTTIADIENELKYIGKDYISAYRKGIRYVDVFCGISKDGVIEQELEIKDQGVYIITGGTGGIGLEIARFLSSKNHINLALLNRSVFPYKEEWQNILTNGEDKNTINKIEIINDIEKKGTNIELYSVDVSNEEDLKKVLDDLRKKYGNINGVVHGAGIAMDCALDDKGEDSFSQVISSKIYGTWVLDKLTWSDEMDFFVMFSSVATIFTMFGQGDYAAANSYMDSYTAYRNRTGRKTLTINWTTWKETGMAARYGFVFDTIFKTLPTARGVEGFEALLKMGARRGLIGEINYEGIGNSLLERSGVRLSEDITAKMLLYKRKTGMAAISRVQNNSGEIRLAGRKNGRYTETEIQIAEICRNTLGFDEIDVYDNFFEMGADSILLMKIQAEIEKLYPIKITVVDMFEYTTISKLAEYIVDKSEGTGEKRDKAINVIRGNVSDIAIIGMSLKFPMADNAEEYWSNIRNGLDCVTLLPETRQEDVRRYIKFKNIPVNAVEYDTGAFLERIDEFDNSYFRIPPKEASLTDPNHRLFLQAAVEAIIDAGYGGKKITGTNTGVYLGFASTQMYFLLLINDVEPSSQSASLVGNTAAVSTGRVSYQLDLKGPSMVVDSACSSSLVAVHTACKAIRAGECDQAIAGGVRVVLLPAHSKGDSRGIGMDSSDGRARTFDDNSDGTGSGEGVAAIMLKPLKKAIEDGDNIYAVIKGSAANQDGSSAGITAPNPAAQERVVIKAWEDAGIDPETISFIEAHGTGTQLGDPIEIKGIQNAFEKFTNKKQFCAIGSVKTNIAHLSEAAGIAGLIKAVLALKNKEIPPSQFFNIPNRKISFGDSPVYVNTVARKWAAQDHPRRCGISAFGMSGTNCHVVLEEFVPTDDHAEEGPADDAVNVLTLSAKSLEALKKLIGNYETLISNAGNLVLKDICYTANTGREHYDHRIAIVAEGIKDLLQKLEKINISGPENLNDTWFYFGRHRIVAEDKEQKGAGEITEKVRQELCRQSDDKMEEIICLEGLDRELLGEICGLYIKGASVGWGKLYNKGLFHTVSLPTYPFEAKRCWIDIPDYNNNTDPEVAEGGYYYKNIWVREELPDTPQINGCGAVLVFKGNHKLSGELTAGLNENGRDIIEVELGDRFEKLGEYTYRVGSTQEDYNSLLNEIKERTVTKVVHMFTLTCQNHIENLAELEERQKRGVYSLFYITKALLSSGINRNVDVVLISQYAGEVTGEEERISPWNMPLFGLAKVVRLENANIMCRCIDTDDYTVARSIMKEIRPDTGAYQVSYRKGIRYVEELKEYSTDSAEEKNVEIKEEGVYVITGGTGGMGIEISKYLATGKKVNIALLNRYEIPDRKCWNELIKNGGRKDKKTVQKINSIREIEALGVQVSYYSADISDFEKVSSIFTELKDRFGRINGIVHAAGIPGEGFLFNKDEKAFKDVLYPKVFGTWILELLTKDDDLDFFVCCSSVASIFPGKGQSDYAAANAFLDSYAAYKHRQGKKAVTFNWVAWKDTGMAVDYGVNIDTSFKALHTTRCIKAFDTVLNKNISRILVGEINYGSDIILSLDIPNLKLPQTLRNAIEKTKENMKAYYKTKYKSLSLMGGGSDSNTELEEKLAQAYSEVLGLTEINIHDSFYEMGGDSITLNRLHSIIEIQYPGRIKLLDLFEYTSIYKLSRYIAGETEQNNTEAQTEDIEGETRKLIDGLENGTMTAEDVINSLYEE